MLLSGSTHTTRGVNFVKLFNEMSFNEMVFNEMFNEIQRKNCHTLWPRTRVQLRIQSIKTTQGMMIRELRFCNPVPGQSTKLIKKLNPTNIDSITNQWQQRATRQHKTKNKQNAHHTRGKIWTPK